MGSMSIALGLYSVYEEMQQDLEGTLHKAKAIGYEGVEFYGEFTQKPEAIRDLLQAIGLVHCGWHTEWNLLQPDTIAATLDYHLRAGTRNVIIPALGGPWHIGHKESEESAAMWINHAKRMNDISELLGEHDLRLGYHTHAHEFSTYFGGASVWQLLCEHTNKHVILQLDTGNCIEGGADPAQVLKTIPGRPLLLHCKPFSHELGHETFIGDGQDDNDWAAIVGASHRSGTEWLIVEHESGERCPGFYGAQRCFDGLKQHLT
ncbi:sugar phosphate isomerase/epimerase [Paenibacillaceae bacterium]|nr:sugar phosphate isomerase/epimerase [Paenibacillaceae bacterium]